MPLLNYTTSVSVDRTIAEITKRLVAAGATSILSTYDGGEAYGLSFAIETEFGQRRFALPVRSESVHRVLAEQRVAPKYATPAHARRVGWRILKDWIEAQLAIVETGMVSLDEVMLPYMIENGETTVFSLYRSSQLRAIGASEEGE